MVTLDTDRLILRMLREADLDAYAEMCADSEVMRHIGDGRPLHSSRSHGRGTFTETQDLKLTFGACFASGGAWKNGYSLNPNTFAVRFAGN